ncbi:MAG: DUF4856 domain-containing protein [Bacteroidota bacterium]
MKRFLTCLAFLGIALSCSDDDSISFDSINITLVGSNTITATLNEPIAITFSVASPAGYASNSVSVSPDNAGTSTVTSIGVGSPGGAATVTFTPSLEGQVTLTFMGTDNNGDTAEASVTINVEEGDPNPVTATPIGTGFLQSPLSLIVIPDLIDENGEVFEIPDFYDTADVFAPIAFSGQISRRAQLNAMIPQIEAEEAFADGFVVNLVTEGSPDFETKIDEVRFDEGNTIQSDLVVALADSLEETSENFAVTPSNGTAGFATYTGGQGHFTANGLELNTALVNLVIGGVFYDQITDDYLRPQLSGPLTNGGNARQASNDDNPFEEEGTERQHGFDESFGYFGITDDSYPNASLPDGGGEFIAELAFQFGDEVEAAFGVNLAERMINAFIIGRSALKAGEVDVLPQDTITNNEVYFTARRDVILYAQATLAATIFHFLDAAAASPEGSVDRVHNLSQALSWIYALSYTDPDNGLQENPQPRQLASNDVIDLVLVEFGWAPGGLLDEIYDINLWEITDDQISDAENALDQYFPGFADIDFQMNN